MAAVALRRLSGVGPAPTVAVVGLLAGAAQAHPLQAGAPVEWPMAWNFEPWIVACLLLSAAGYAFGLARLWAGAGVGRGVSRVRAAAFAGGWLALVAALVSPLDPLGEHLFSAHMLQHELLMVVAAPLLCVARPLAVWIWALPMAARRALGSGSRHPAWAVPWRIATGAIAGWMLHAVVLWGWHVPWLFEAARADVFVHTLQHLSFLASALLFWWAVLKPTSRGAQGVALVYLFTTMVHTSALGALMTLSPLVWYPGYLPSADALGVDALEDQQLGGLVMWVPAGLSYFATGLALAARLIQHNAPMRHGAPSG